MEQLYQLAFFLGSIGILLLGLAALWFVAVYSEKKKK
jgi:hypothetical protein